MRTFFRGCLIFLLIIGGIAGVMTVDIRTGHMAGYQPAIDVRFTEVPITVEDGNLAKEYNFTIVCNKKLLSD
ncbi:MAG: hypothetical protein ACK5MV_10215 [Aminipila sp.]